MATCPLAPGYYYISTREHQFVGVSQSAVAVNGTKMRFHITKNGTSPNCTYEITFGSNFAQDDHGEVAIGHYHQQWEIKQWGQVYTVQLKGTNRAWTDPQGPPSPHRQLYLDELNAALPWQQFWFTKA
ncbi:hypothetical protein SCLCIDRAFT_1211046 [Scleroderma citrinum Foug A]|uniref:Carbohydrate-binding module family 13 protein n=1 Tax=Scleroderma citrinum Foug A TaxID=1036808 RepID=A0A0C3EFC3_9AGAM|nr:hypothetical protein SCLCIDRAFT_1211046 [Scleroderma citrinum Foug A]